MCLAITLESAESQLRASDGREVPFTRAILTIRNACREEVAEVIPHAALGQEGGTVQDVTGSLSHSPSSIPPGGSVRWDVYDLLLPAHPGTASKIHMFGYRAALNWKFDLEVWAAYRLPASPGPATTPVTKWRLQWSVSDSATGSVGLTIAEIKN